MQVEGLESDIAYVTLTQARDFADFFGMVVVVFEKNSFFAFFCGFLQEKPWENDAI